MNIICLYLSLKEGLRCDIGGGENDGVEHVLGEKCGL